MPRSSTVFAAMIASIERQRYGRHLEGRVLRFAGPLELRVEVRIVGVGLAARVLVGIGRHETDGRVVEPLFVPVVV